VERGEIEMKNRFWKYMSVSLIMVMLMGMLPTTTMQSAEGGEIPISDNILVDLEEGRANQDEDNVLTAQVDFPIAQIDGSIIQVTAENNLTDASIVGNEVTLRNAVSTEGSGDVVLSENIGNLTTQLTIERDITLDLNGNALTIYLDAETGNTSSGIKIDPGVALTITDSAGGGTLSITNRADYLATPGNGAAINTADGTIIVEGGRVSAYGGYAGAGIGGGVLDAGGNIVINGGIVNASGWSGAGIGGGNYGAGGSIVINGGTINASSGWSGAGIGGGNYGAGGSITINGGTVIAVSERYGAGIGSAGTVSVGLLV